MKKIFFLCFCLIYFFTLQPALADDKEAISNLIKTNVNKVLFLLKDKTLDKEIKLKQIMDIINPLFDFPLMAKLSLGKTYWPSLNDEQKQKFTTLFIEQLQNSYYDKLELFSDESLIFNTPIEAGNKFQMQIDIITADEPVKMLYKLYPKENNWKIYDLEIQDISIIKSYSTQYAQILKDSGVDELLRQMKLKNTESKISTIPS